MSAGYTRISNIVLDCYLADLSGGETKAYLYIDRRTAGFQKVSDGISVSQICNGIRKRDGTVLDRGTGLSRETVVAALAGLQQKGLVVRTLGTGTIPDSYAIVELEQSENPTDSGRKIRPVSSRKTRPLTGRKIRPTKESRKSSSKEMEKKKNPEASVEGSAAGETRQENPKPKTDSLKSDDDKNCFPPESPEARLKAWATNRGDPLSLKDWWDIKAQAEVRGLALGELADLAERNNGHWNSSAAGLRWLLKQFARKTTDAPAEVVTPQPVEKCPKCRCPKGRGTVLVNGRMEACECATAEWRRQIAQAAARDAANGSIDQAGRRSSGASGANRGGGMMKAPEPLPPPCMLCRDFDGLWCAGAGGGLKRCSCPRGSHLAALDAARKANTGRPRSKVLAFPLARDGKVAACGERL